MRGQALTDRLHLYRTGIGWWKWRRETGAGQIIAVSARAYPRQRRCLYAAVRVNRRPYHLDLDGGIEPDFEVDSLAWRRYIS